MRSRLYKNKINLFYQSQICLRWIKFNKIFLMFINIKIDFNAEYKRIIIYNITNI